MGHAAHFTFVSPESIDHTLRVQRERRLGQQHAPYLVDDQHQLALPPFEATISTSTTMRDRIKVLTIGLQLKSASCSVFRVRAGRIRLDAPCFSHSVVQTLGPTILLAAEKQRGRYHRLDQPGLPEDTVTIIYLEQVPFPLHLPCLRAKHRDA